MEYCVRASAEFKKWEGDPSAPITVIVPPPAEDPAPMTFGCWVKDLGIEEREGESDEAYEHNFNLNIYGYKAYLEENSYEYHLDQYRLQLDQLRYAERKGFDFKPEGEKDLPSIPACRKI